MFRKLDQTQTTSPYISIKEQIKEEIEIAIINGSLKSTKKAPTIAEMSEMFGISNSTTKKVAKELVDDGVFIKQVGVCNYINPYVKSDLKKRHIEKLISTFVLCFEKANKMGLKEDEINSIVREAKNKYPHGE